MLVAQDGNIVIKQWALVLDDVIFYASAAPVLVRVASYTHSTHPTPNLH